MARDVPTHLYVVQVWDDKKQAWVKPYRYSHPNSIYHNRIWAERYCQSCLKVKRYGFTPPSKARIVEYAVTPTGRNDEIV